MKEYWIVAAVPAIAALAMMLIGRAADKRWGVDTSRMTPAMERTGGKSALLLLALLLLACMGPAMICTIVVPTPMGVGVLLLGAVLGGVAGYAALFVSIRHEGMSIAGVLEEEIGAAAGKAAHALAAVAMAIAASVVAADWLYRLGSPVRYAQGMPVICAVMLMMALFAYAPGVLAARQIRSEGDAGALAMGGALVSTLLPLAFSAMQDVESCTIPITLWPLLMLIGDGCTLLALVYMGSRAIGALFARRTYSRRRPSLVGKLLPLLAMILLTALALIAAGEVAVLRVAWPTVCAVLCALLTAMTACVCALWFGRIGRGGRWLYALGVLALAFAMLILL